MKNFKISTISFFFLLLYYFFGGWLLGYLYAWGSESYIKIASSSVMSIAVSLTWISFYIRGRRSIVEIKNTVDFVFFAIFIGTGIGISDRIVDQGFYKSINVFLFETITLIMILAVVSLLGGWLFLKRIQLKQQ